MVTLFVVFCWFVCLGGCDDQEVGSIEKARKMKQLAAFSARNITITSFAKVEDASGYGFSFGVTVDGPLPDKVPVVMTELEVEFSVVGMTASHPVCLAVKGWGDTARGTVIFGTAEGLENPEALSFDHRATGQATTYPVLFDFYNITAGDTLLIRRVKAKFVVNSPRTIEKIYELRESFTYTSTVSSATPPQLSPTISLDSQALGVGTFTFARGVGAASGSTYWDLKVEKLVNNQYVKVEEELIELIVDVNLTDNSNDTYTFTYAFPANGYYFVSVRPQREEAAFSGREEVPVTSVP